MTNDLKTFLLIDDKHPDYFVGRIARTDANRRRGPKVSQLRGPLPLLVLELKRHHAFRQRQA